MAVKKNVPKRSSNPSGGIRVSNKEREALKKGALADMRKHGFKTVEELEAYYDSKRGY